ncbi:RhuM family protein [Lawsonibacter sp. LCP25S3_G6]|uniref:RhuM family protein n=1 Tax=unclassified Lawsonibacter TaxID=2617946 RepID=UPI003F9DA1A1
MEKYLTQFYNLAAIVSVRYRVNSRRATHCGIWATGVLSDKLIHSHKYLSRFTLFRRPVCFLMRKCCNFAHYLNIPERGCHF